MKNTAILIAICVATPLVFIPLLKAWHTRPEIFGVTGNTAIAQTTKKGQKLSNAERKTFLELLKQCPLSGGDPSSLDDTDLNALTLDCKRHLSGS